MRPDSGPIVHAILVSETVDSMVMRSLLVAVSAVRIAVEVEKRLQCKAISHRSHVTFHRSTLPSEAMSEAVVTVTRTPGRCSGAGLERQCSGHCDRQLRYNNLDLRHASRGDAVPDDTHTQYYVSIRGVCYVSVNWSVISDISRSCDLTGGLREAALLRPAVWRLDYLWERDSSETL